MGPLGAADSGPSRLTRCTLLVKVQEGPRGHTRVQAPQSPWSEKSEWQPREGGHGWTVPRDLCLLTVSPTVSSVPACGPTQKESHEVPLRVPGTSTGFPETSGYHLKDTCAGAPVRVFTSCFLELRKCERLCGLQPSCHLAAPSPSEPEMGDTSHIQWSLSWTMKLPAPRPKAASLTCRPTGIV